MTSSPPRPSSSPSVPAAIVGAGPVGLALGLARQGVRSVLVEREPTTSEWSRAPGIHVRTREVLRQWGLEERFLDAGVLLRKVTLHPPVHDGRPLVSVDFSDLDPEADRPGLLVLEQSRTERLLLDAVRETGLCDVRFGTEAVALEPRDDGAALVVRGSGAEAGPDAGARIDAKFVVGCDGASSFVRDALGLSFEGITYTVRPMLADVRIDDARDALAWPRTRNGPDGITSLIRLSPGLWRLIRLERGEPDAGDDVPEPEVRQRIGEVLGDGPLDVVWSSRFRIHRRASPRFRLGRVLLAGDAAHVHSPAGGLGMNGGIQDAHNLAWKLAYALRGGDMERLLDSYEVERRAAMVDGVSRYADFLTRTTRPRRSSTPASAPPAFASRRPVRPAARLRHHHRPRRLPRPRRRAPPPPGPRPGLDPGAARRPRGLGAGRGCWSRRTSRLKGERSWPSLIFSLRCTIHGSLRSASHLPGNPHRSEPSQNA